MLNLEQIMGNLQDRKLTVVSKRTGVPYTTVLRVAKGRNKNVTYSTLSRLSEYFETPVVLA
jgi:predicted transcriptional regulator